MKSQPNQAIGIDSVNVTFFNSSKEFKIETTYYKSGKIKSEIVLFQGVMISSKEYSELGILLLEYNYNLEGEQMGSQRQYYANGKIQKEENIVNYSTIERIYEKEKIEIIVANETFKEYYENGVLKKEGVYFNGEKVGLYKEFDYNGKIKILEYYILKQ